MMTRELMARDDLEDKMLVLMVEIERLHRRLDICRTCPVPIGSMAYSEWLAKIVLYSLELQEKTDLLVVCWYEHNNLL